MIIFKPRARPAGAMVLAALLCGAGCPPAMDRPRPGAPDVSTESSLPQDLPAQDASALAMAGPWVTVKAGTFMMGSPPPASELCRESNEPQHDVRLTHDFDMMAREVTQGQFSAAMGYNPSHNTSCGEKCPVEQVTWHMAAAYCNEISKKSDLLPCYACSNTGKATSCVESAAAANGKIYACPGVRLPTEAEWEYAYRAGKKEASYNGDISSALCDKCPSKEEPTVAVDPAIGPIAWYCVNSHSQTHPGAEKLPNAWGLYDMAGNVWEWVGDWYHPEYGLTAGQTTVIDPAVAESSASGFGDYRVARGGGWAHAPRYLRAAVRRKTSPTEVYNSFGFRCVRSRLTP